MTTTTTIQKLRDAEAKALELFAAIETNKIIQPGKSEKQLSDEVFEMAFDLFGIKKYWHKRLVRAGANTLRPYHENPPELTLQEDDILFFDFGPVFEDWEADIGRTYVIGNDPLKLKLKNNVENCWQEARDWYREQSNLTGAELYRHIMELAAKYGWEFGGKMAGHIIGNFPHEKLEPGNNGLYIHPGNHNNMFLPDADGNERHWILEIHFIDREKQIGSFFEQLLM